MNTTTTVVSVLRRPTYKVPANQKKEYVAKFLKHEIEKGNDITEYVGKPLNWFDYDVIYEIVTGYEQQKLKIEENKKGGK